MICPSRKTHYRPTGSPIRIQWGNLRVGPIPGFVGSTTLVGTTLSTTTMSRAPTSSLNAY